MSIRLKSPYLLLLAGDMIIFVISLWCSLLLRTFALPDQWVFLQHFQPFSILFLFWALVFFLAGLYGKHTRIMRTQLPQTILYAQVVNVSLAAIFFFIIPYFGITPKTLLAIYLVVSSVLIYAWRVYMFPLLQSKERLPAILIGSGPNIDELHQEVNKDERYPFIFTNIIDTRTADLYQVIQQVTRTALSDKDAVIVADTADKAMQAVLPILYDAAFRDRRLAFLDVRQVYQDVFDRMPLSLMQYDWVLGAIHRAKSYDILKRIVDGVLGVIFGALSLIVYPFVMLAIKLDDGGEVFIRQERVGRFEKPIHIVKFRSMTGNDSGNYTNGKSTLTVTRVGKWLRLLRIDELPQLWNVVRGELSFVGPRPELPNLAKHYDARIPYYNARYLIAPGLTGWAQLRHDRDPHHSADVAETKKKLSYDLYYLQHRSLLLDLFILFQTVKIVLTARGT